MFVFPFVRVKEAKRDGRRCGGVKMEEEDEGRRDAGMRTGRLWGSRGQRVADSGGGMQRGAEWQ